MKHILARHAKNFERWGLSPEQVLALIRDTLKHPVYSSKGGGVVYLVNVGGVVRKLRIIVSDNGYVVTAYPTR